MWTNCQHMLYVVAGDDLLLSLHWLIHTKLLICKVPKLGMRESSQLGIEKETAASSTRVSINLVFSAAKRGGKNIYVAVMAL